MKKTVRSSRKSLSFIITLSGGDETTNVYRRAKQNVARSSSSNERLEEEKRQLRWCLEQERVRAPEVKLGAVSEAFGESASEGKAERSTAASSVKGSEVLSPPKFVGGTSDNPFKGIYAPYTPERPLQSPTVTVSQVLAPSVPTQAPLGPVSSVPGQFGFATGTGVSFGQGPQVTASSVGQGPSSSGQARDSMPSGTDNNGQGGADRRFGSGPPNPPGGGGPGDGGGSGNEGSYMSVDSSGSEEDVRATPKLRKRRWKEQDSINIPQLPQEFQTSVAGATQCCKASTRLRADLMIRHCFGPSSRGPRGHRRSSGERVPDKFRTLSMKAYYCLAESCSRRSGTTHDSKSGGWLQMGRTTPGLVLLRWFSDTFRQVIPRKLCTMSLTCLK